MINKHFDNSLKKILEYDSENKNEIVEFLNRFPREVLDNIPDDFINSSFKVFGNDGSIYSYRLAGDSLTLEQKFPLANIAEPPIFLRYELMLNANGESLGTFKNEYKIRNMRTNPETLRDTLFPYLNFKDSYVSGYNLQKEVSYEYSSKDCFIKKDLIFGTEETIPYNVSYVKTKKLSDKHLI